MAAYRAAYAHMIRPACVLAAALMLGVPPVRAAEQVFFTASTSRARPLAMGGAFTAVADDFFASTGNPANLREHDTRKTETRMVRCHLNPVLPAALVSADDSGEDGLGTFWAASLLKGVSLRSHALSFGLSLFEASPLGALRHGSERFINADGVYDNHSNTVSMHFRLAPSIAMGASGSLYYQQDEGRRRYGGGISYGILMRPSEKLNIGLVYFNFPDDFQFMRQTGDRLADETINGGMAYRITPTTLVALDLRNLTDDANVGARELHFGVETELFRMLALRSGLYGERGGDNLVWSFGSGLARGTLDRLPWWEHALGAIDYSFTYESAPGRIWHALSVVYTI